MSAEALHQAAHAAAPSAIDISSEAVAERLRWMRDDPAFLNSNVTADMLEALAADRDRLAVSLAEMTADRNGCITALGKYTAALKELPNGEPPSDDALAAAYREINSKYFGDYQCTEEQRAVAVLARASRFMRQAIADRDRHAWAWAEASESLETTSGYLASARTFVRSARAIIQEYASQHPRHVWDGREFDALGAHAWLAAEATEIGTARDGGDPKAERT